MSTVLIVEDDEAIAQGVRDNLEFEGHHVLVACNGEIALRMVQDRNPDLIILDIRLPGMSGFEVCRKLRPAQSHTPFLMLTARGEDDDRVLGLDLGADDYVAKPFSVRELLARVRALLRRTSPAPDLPGHTRIGEIAIDFHRYEARQGDRT